MIHKTTVILEKKKSQQPICIFQGFFEPHVNDTEQDSTPACPPPHEQ